MFGARINAAANVFASALEVVGLAATVASAGAACVGVYLTHRRATRAAQPPPVTVWLGVSTPAVPEMPPREDPPKWIPPDDGPANHWATEPGPSKLPPLPPQEAKASLWWSPEEAPVQRNTPHAWATKVKSRVAARGS